ncbi:MAG: hypothetical protein A2Z20_12640 [Bdellovibrionales bacterium RBG_16_40_8]|nr:MAG: hypothetical protein A2Z20_12640 [Bdellovibrionales bacterium RBG_16_40_8]
MRIPIPNGVEKGRLLNAYFEKCGHRSNESEPILPSQLQKAKSKLKPDHYNWIYLSVWLGLRPREVDQLKNDRFVRLQPGLHKKLILWIYQTKLSAVPPQYRWKLIPIIFTEQETALKILRPKHYSLRRSQGIYRSNARTPARLHSYQSMDGPLFD